MGLKPLEFSDCLLDSPYFRESIHDHEKELDQANDAIKSLIKESRNLIKALENLSRAQFSFTAMLENFKLRYIGEVETEDKLEYEDAFLSFAQIFQKVEEERVRMLDHANIQLIEPLDKFRKEQIGRAKDEKRKFDRETERVCGLLESHLKLSPKKKDTALQEADVQLEHELRNFREMSLDYVTKLQEVNEKKKFELVEIILSYMYGQATFYHNGHEVFQDHKSYLTDLQFKLQTTRDRYDITKDAADDLKNKTKRRFTNGELHKGRYAREGYLLVYDKRKSVLSAQWVKHYCFYTKENKILTMVPHNQTNVKLVANTDTLVVTSCVRKITETSDRRFLFDITGQVRSQPITLQAMSEEDRKQWLEVMEGREPIYVDSSELVNQAEGITRISDVGVQFVTKCMEAVETRGITDQGIYRIAGVSSKFNKLLNTGIDPKNIEKLDLISENSPWDIKTITSAMKQYFRTLSEPIFTFKHHHEFLNAIKLDTHAKKMEKLKELVKLLPEVNFKILHRLMYHLKLVASHSKDNLMQESNLSVVLGPTLMRPKEETMAAIMSIKFQSMVIENIIKEYDQIFGEGPPPDFKGNGNNNDVPVSPTSPKFIAKSSNPERTPSTKHRAPPPARPSVLPKKISDPDNRNINVIQQKPALADRPSNGTANKEGVHLLTNQLSAPPAVGPKPQRVPFPGARFAVGAKFAETVPPFTGISEESSNVPRRSESYATAMHKVANTAQSEQRVPPPIIKPTAAPPKVPKRNEWKVRALYDCVAENTAELSFNKDAIITNVRASTEEGWLIGMLNGKTGLVPENYCAKIG